MAVRTSTGYSIPPQPL